MPTSERMLEMIDKGVEALPEILAPSNPDGFRADKQLTKELTVPLFRLVNGGKLDALDHGVVALWLDMIAAELSHIRTKFPERYPDVCNLLGCAWMLLDDMVKIDSTTPAR